MSTSTTTTTNGSSKAKLIYRPSDSRGHADHDWLKTYHSFSFASWYDPEHVHWGPLRVLNEDRVSPKNGFPTHPHREAEIFSVVVDGIIGHKDSMGNVENLRRGDVQMTSGGTGIAHSEYNGGKNGEHLHFLQIWAQPSTRGLRPKYFTRHFTDDEKRDKLARIVAPEGAQSVTDEREGAGPAPIHADLTCFSSILSPGKTVEYTYPSTSSAARKGYLHLIMRQTGYRTPAQKPSEHGPALEVTLAGDGQKINVVEGDGAYLDHVEGQTVTFRNTGASDAEFVFFDLGDKVQ